MSGSQPFLRPHHEENVTVSSYPLYIYSLFKDKGGEVILNLVNKRKSNIWIRKHVPDYLIKLTKIISLTKIPTYENERTNFKTLI